MYNSLINVSQIEKTHHKTIENNEDEMKKAMLVVVLLTISFLTGCAAKSPKPSGFLSNYPKLQESSKIDGAMVWKKEGVTLKDYDNVLVEPVQTFFDLSDDKYSDVDPAEIEELTTYGTNVLTGALSSKFTVVKKTGARTVIVRAAITDVETSIPVMNAVSSVIPVGIVFSYGRSAITGSHTGVGVLQYEVVFLDGVTHEPLAVLVHRKSGEKWDFSGITDDLGHVRSQFDLIAEKMGEDAWYFVEAKTDEE